MITIARLTVRELSVFINDLSADSREVLPISKLRAMSFMSNPNADSSDVVLYLAYRFDKLIGSRTVLPDIMYINGEPIKVAWLSASWVHSEYRRKGISTELLNAIDADWDQRLLTSNFTPYAKQLYSKSQKFVKLIDVVGARFYLKSTFLHSYNSCRHSNFMLAMLERVINWFNPSFFFRHFLTMPNGVDFEYFSRPDEELCCMFENATADTLTRRSRDSWNWVLRFPWLKSAPLGDRIASKYFFASAPPVFNQYVLKVFRYGECVGMLHIQHSHTRLSVPYSYFEPEHAGLMARVVLMHAKELNATFIVSYNNCLISELRRHRIFFLSVRARKREYLATEYMVARLRGLDLHFADGDGDCAFI